jgi:hypothetical protein
MSYATSIQGKNFTYNGKRVTYSIPIDNGPPAFLTTDGSTMGWYMTDTSSQMRFVSYPRTVNGLYNQVPVSGWNLDDPNNVAYWNEVPLDTSLGLYFDGNSEIWQNGGSPVIPQPYIIYAVLSKLVLANGGYAIWLNSAGSLQSSFGASRMNYNGILRDVSLGKYQIYRMVGDGANSTFQIGDGSIGGATTTGSIDGLSIGGGQSAIGMREIIVRGKHDSPADELAIYNYLKTKYNL